MVPLASCSFDAANSIMKEFLSVTESTQKLAQPHGYPTNQEMSTIIIPLRPLLQLAFRLCNTWYKVSAMTSTILEGWSSSEPMRILAPYPADVVSPWRNLSKNPPRCIWKLNLCFLGELSLVRVFTMRQKESMNVIWRREGDVQATRG